MISGWPGNERPGILLLIPMGRGDLFPSEAAGVRIFTISLGQEKGNAHLPRRGQYVNPFHYPGGGGKERARGIKNYR